MNPTFSPFLDPSFWFTSAFLFLILKWMFVVGVGLYAVFALVIVRQVAVMGKTVHTGYEAIFTLLAYAHLGFALVIVWLAITTL